MTRSKRRWLRWFTAIVVLLILLTAAVGFTYEAIGRRRDSRHPFRVGTAVDIGGRSLNIDCAGTGSPAVILEAGGGGRGGYGWREVQSGVATFTTVCWYDRAGEAGAILHRGHAAAPPSFKTCMNFFRARGFPVHTCWLATQSVENTFEFILPSSPLRLQVWCW